MTAALIIPFRDRGIDPYRPLNLEFVTGWWAQHGCWPVYVVDDGRTGTEPFNRSAAYNRAVAAHPEVDTFVFTESDVFCDPEQIVQGVELAQQAPGLVVGFSKFLEITELGSIAVRTGELGYDEAPVNQIRVDRGSNGAINIISRETYEMVSGYDESFSAAWFDDDAMERAFDICCGRTRYVDGPVFHLFHASGGRAGAASTAADRAATERNRLRWELYRRATTPEQIRALTMGTVDDDDDEQLIEDC